MKALLIIPPITLALEVARVHARSLGAVKAVVIDATLNIVWPWAIGIRIPRPGARCASRRVLAGSVNISELRVLAFFADIPRVGSDHVNVLFRFDSRAETGDTWRG